MADPFSMAVVFRILVRASRFGCHWLGLHPVEFIQLFLSLFFLDAISFLDHADELVFLAGDPGQIVIRKLPPFFFHFSAELFPVAFNLI